jgi:hypothetical protein
MFSEICALIVKLTAHLQCLIVGLRKAFHVFVADACGGAGLGH